MVARFGEDGSGRESTLDDGTTLALCVSQLLCVVLLPVYVVSFTTTKRRVDRMDETDSLIRLLHTLIIFDNKPSYHLLRCCAPMVVHLVTFGYEPSWCGYASPSH